MSDTKNMLSVLMDGIKDTEMMIDYANDATDQQWTEWFKTRAKKRLDQLASDYDYAVKAIDLDAKVKAGDIIADALATHLKQQMSNLEKEYSAIHV